MKKKLSLRERQRREDAANGARAITTLVGKKKLMPAEVAQLRRQGAERLDSRRVSMMPTFNETITRQLMQRTDGTGSWQPAGPETTADTVTIPSRIITPNGEVPDYHVRIIHRSAGTGMRDIETEEDCALNELGHQHDKEINHLRQLGRLKRP